MSEAACDTSSPSKSHDLACGGSSLLIWIAPTVILGITASIGGLYAAIAWPPLLVFMGAACLVNAKLCGRLHCFITGPYFLVLAVVSLLYAIGILPLGAHGWSALLSALLIGACVLTCVPEWLFGKYVRLAHKPRADTL